MLVADNEMTEECHKDAFVSLQSVRIYTPTKLHLRLRQKSKRQLKNTVKRDKKTKGTSAPGHCQLRGPSGDLCGHAWLSLGGHTGAVGQVTRGASRTTVDLIRTTDRLKHNSKASLSARRRMSPSVSWLALVATQPWMTRPER